MRHQTREFVDAFLKDHGPFERVLDVGSLDINGNLRGYFKDSTYIGVDIQAGENVDQIVDGHALVETFGEDSFDLVLCFDTFEHDSAFWVTWEQMKRVCKPGGWLLFGAPGPHCPEHNHPNDYWRFMPQAFSEVFLAGLEDPHFEVQTDDPDHQQHDEVYGRGRKPL